MRIRDAGVILEEMADTYRERSLTYGAQFHIPPQVIKAMFPNGVPSSLVTKTQWHLFEMVVTRLVRFAHSNLQHVDSIHDIGVYSAIIEEVLVNEEQEQ